MAEALVAMHAAGVTHRDLTPGNVILGRSGPRVIDFGVARAQDTTPLTQIGVKVGTPAWMAPEQARGERAGPESDTFAWGLLVAFAGTGRNPFGSGPAEMVLHRVLHESPDFTGLDPAHVAPVTDALSKEPTDRPTPVTLLRELGAPERTGPAVRDGAGTAAVLPATAAEPASALAVRDEPPASPAPRTPVATSAPTDPGVRPRPHPPALRHGARRFAAVSIIALLVVGAALGLGALLGALLDDDSSPRTAPASQPSDEERAPVPSTEAPSPSTTVPTRSVAAYCSLASDYYARLDQLQELDVFESQEEEDAALVEFASDNERLVRRIAAVAPRVIADDARVVAEAFARLADGDTSALDADPVQEAEANTNRFEELECGIDRDGPFL